jgi:hypothetical protein
MAILGSPLRELTGFYLAVDCLTAGCGGERSYAVAELASFDGQDQTGGAVLRRMRCGAGCGGRVMAAWLGTGPILNRRVRPKRVPLMGPEARSDSGGNNSRLHPQASILFLLATRAGY